MSTHKLPETFHLLCSGYSSQFTFASLQHLTKKFHIVFFFFFTWTMCGRLWALLLSLRLYRTSWFFSSNLVDSLMKQLHGVIDRQIFQRRLLTSSLSVLKFFYKPIHCFRFIQVLERRVFLWFFNHDYLTIMVPFFLTSRSTGIIYNHGYLSKGSMTI